MMDLTAHVLRRPQPGETVIGHRFVQRLGGKGFNQAVAAARAGAETTMVGAVGDDDYGRAFVVALSHERITARLTTIDGVGTGVGLPVIESDGGNSIVVVPRANERLTPADVERWGDVIEAADVLCLQLEGPTSAALTAARIARAAGRQVVLNPAPARTGSDDLLALSTVLVPNEVEAAMLAGVPPSTPPDEVAAVLTRRFPGVRVVVTAGPAGAVMGGTHPTWCRAPTVVSIDSVGAGDVFCGYLAAGLAAAAPLERAVASAVAAASLSVTRNGGAEHTPYAADIGEGVRP